MDPATVQMLVQAGGQLLSKFGNEEDEEQQMISRLLGQNSASNLSQDFTTQGLTPNMSLSNKLMR